MESFHDRLRRLRKSRGMTIRDLAKKIDVPETTYREWEYGRSVRGHAFHRHWYLSRVIGTDRTITNFAMLTVFIFYNLKFSFLEHGLSPPAPITSASGTVPNLRES